MNNGVLNLLPLAAFCLLFLLQTILPRRNKRPVQVLSSRMLHNCLLGGINVVITRWLIPLNLIFLSQWAEQNTWGLFNNRQVTPALEVVLCVLIFDFAIYLQHVATHYFPLLWRFHKVHHGDHEMDVTTAIRFHPIEIVFSLLYKMLLVVLLGAPVLAVVLFEILLFCGAAFNHSNLYLPKPLDGFLRCFIVTPDVHRAHHSVYKQEQNSNYGFLLIIWDRLFNSFTTEPRDGHTEMRLGLSVTEPQQTSTLDQMISLPFR